MMKLTTITTTTVGNLRSLNELARQARADHIIHTGDFGFYDDSSLDRIAEKYVIRVNSPGAEGGGQRRRRRRRRARWQSTT